jgi:hypothetical protein
MQAKLPVAFCSMYTKGWCSFTTPGTTLALIPPGFPPPMSVLAARHQPTCSIRLLSAQPECCSSNASSRARVLRPSPRSELSAALAAPNS